MSVHWTKSIFCHCQVALCKLFTFIIISVHVGQFKKFQIEDIRRGGAKIWIPFSSGENIILRMSAWCTSKVPVFVPTPQRWQWGARVVQWWGHLPPTDVARDRILALTAYLGWVCCWFSHVFGQVFPRVHRFSPLLKNLQFQFNLECMDTFWQVLKNSFVLHG